MSPDVLDIDLDASTYIYQDQVYPSFENFKLSKTCMRSGSGEQKCFSNFEPKPQSVKFSWPKTLAGAFSDSSVWPEFPAAKKNLFHRLFIRIEKLDFIEYYQLYMEQFYKMILYTVDRSTESSKRYPTR